MKPFSISLNWIGIFTVILILGGWQIAAVIIKSPLLLPTPWTAFWQIGQLVITRGFWHNLSITLIRGLIGFGLSFLAGIMIGLPAGRIKLVGAFFKPLIIFIRSTPVISVIVLALIWLKRDLVPIFVTCLMAFPIVVQNVIEGVNHIDRELYQMVTLYQVRKWRIFKQLYLPSLAPFLAASISNGLGITWKALVAAEVLSYPTWGIGIQLDTARVYLQTDRVFAWTIVVIALGLLFDYGLDLLMKNPFNSWSESRHG